MKSFIKATLVQSDNGLLENKWFSENPEIVRDNINKCYSELKKQAYEIGIDLSTEDINPTEFSNLVIFIDVPTKKYFKLESQIWYLLVIEAPGVYKKNWQKINHSEYDKIFTWNEDWIDNEKYFLLRFAYDLSIYKNQRNFNDRKFLTMIAGSKSSKYPESLYQARYDIIKWFSKYHPEEFDLYGFKWPERLHPLFESRVKKIIPAYIKRWISNLFPLNRVYRGCISRKKEVLSNYKYSISYENIKGLKGYITEKIFDSFCAGCVPVYWGAENVAQLIPQNCFINGQDFNNIGDLYKYLKSITKDDFTKYQKNIKFYLNSERISPFLPTNFSNTLMNHIIKDLKIKH